MQKHLPTIALFLMGSIVWGYFVDLRHGEIGSFVGRLIFTTIAALGYSMYVHRNDPKKPDE